MITRLARRHGFTCTHRYNIDQWTENENRQVFGACFTPHGHGHNYELEVYLEGPVSPQTGMVINLVDVDNILKETVLPVAGKHLNFEVSEFNNKVPTTELVAEFLFERCEKLFKPLGVKVLKLRLYEYDDLWVDVWAK